MILTIKSGNQIGFSEKRASGCAYAVRKAAFHNVDKRRKIEKYLNMINSTRTASTFDTAFRLLLPRKHCTIRTHDFCTRSNLLPTFLTGYLVPLQSLDVCRSTLDAKINALESGRTPKAPWPAVSARTELAAARRSREARFAAAFLKWGTASAGYMDTNIVLSAGTNFVYRPCVGSDLRTGSGQKSVQAFGSSRTPYTSLSI